MPKVAEKYKNNCSGTHNFLLKRPKANNQSQNTYFCKGKQRKNAKKTTYFSNQ